MQIRKRAEVPRQKIYRILTTLEEIGLVEKTVRKPLRYRGILFEQGLELLMKERFQEVQEMKIKAKEVIKNFNLAIFNYKNGVKEIEPNFVLIPKNDASIIKRLEEIENAKSEIDFVTSWKRFPPSVFTFGAKVKKALDRGVKIRVILERPEESDQIPEQVHEFKEYPNYRLRYILKSPRAIIGIFDKQRAIIKTSASGGLAEAPALWTDNPCLISVLSEHFEIMWITALENIPQQIC